MRVVPTTLTRKKNRIAASLDWQFGNFLWRSKADSNRCSSFCRAEPSHSAIRPRAANVAKFRFFTITKTFFDTMHQMAKRIAESELIITERGTIYHLDLAPEHLAPIVITVGDPDRVQAVSKYFDRLEHRAQHREFVTHTGYIGNQRISCVSTGIGPDNIDIVLNELDALVNIDFKTRTIKEQHTSLQIVRLGTSGALQADINVDSFVASSHGLGLDNLMLYYQHTNNAEEDFLLAEFSKHTNMDARHIHPYVAAGAVSLRSQFAKEFHHGVTVTCPGFYGPQGRVLRGQLALPNLIDALTTFSCSVGRITNFEMETSAIYGLGKLLGHKCLSISTIVANRITQQFSSNAPKAVDGMIRSSLDVLTATH
jgi:uridine phosphorylase